MENLHQEQQLVAINTGTSGRDHRTIEDQEHPVKRPFWMLARDWLAMFKPPEFGLRSLDLSLYGWKQHANIVIAGRPGTGTADLAMTLAEAFATNHGEVVWLGLKDDLRGMCERMIFRDAAIEISASGTVILDDADRQKVATAHKRIVELPIHLCDVDQCDGSAVELEFLTAVTSDRPKLIVIDESVFHDFDLNPFDALVRRVNLFRMPDELHKSNRDWRVLWQVPVANSLDTDFDKAPTLADLSEPTVAATANVVMITHMGIDASSELVVLKNDFGSTGTIPLNYCQALSTWSERDAPTNC
jgi:replicative DNA helicase